MLDNLEGSSLSESEVVAKLQANREVSQQPEESAPIESTDYTEAPEGAAEGESYDEPEAESYEQEGEEDSEESAARTWQLKASGEDLNLTEDELIEYAQKGHNFYKKSSELAEERKAFEAQIESHKKQIEDERQNYIAMTNQLAELVKESGQNIDWDELRDTDPSEYLRQKEIQEKRTQAHKEAVEKLQKESEEKRANLVKVESQKLNEIMGERWANEEVRNKDAEGMRSLANSVGITDGELKNISDARFYQLLHKAMLYDQLEAGKDVVQKQIKTAPKTVKSKKPIKPASKQNQKAIDARARLRKSGGKSTDDVVALMQAKRNR